MNKRLAKKLITKQKKTLNTETLKNRIWREETLLYIRNIFGVDGVESLHEHYYFSPYYACDFTKLSESEVQEKVNNLNKIFDIYLSVIDNEMFPRVNKLSNHSIANIITVISLIVTIFCSFAFYEGTRYTNYKIEGLERTIKTLEDSIIIIKTVVQPIGKVQQPNDSNRVENHPPPVIKPNN